MRPARTQQGESRTVMHGKIVTGLRASVALRLLQTEDHDGVVAFRFAGGIVVTGRDGDELLPGDRIGDQASVDRTGA